MGTRPQIDFTDRPKRTGQTLYIPNWMVAAAGILLVAIILVIVLMVKGCSGGQGAQAGESGSGSANAQGSKSIVMTLNGSQDTKVLAGESYVESGCHAFDPTDGDITASVQVEGSVDADTPGDYEITYTATNSQGETAQVTRRVHVLEDMEVDTDGITVFMYHYVYTKNDAPEELNTNYILETDLEAQLAWLKENDYYFPSYQELYYYVKGTHSLPAKSVILTFDDAEEGFLTYGIPLLEKYQIPATSFVICDREDAAQKVATYASPYVTFQSHGYALHNAGTTDQGHGGVVYDMTQEEILADLQAARALLGTNDAFAYPYGDYNDAALEAVAEADLWAAFTTDYSQVKPGDDYRRLGRIRVFGDYSLDSFIYQAEHGE